MEEIVGIISPNAIGIESFIVHWYGVIVRNSISITILLTIKDKKKDIEEDIEEETIIDMIL